MMGKHSHTKLLLTVIGLGLLALLAWSVYDSPSKVHDSVAPTAQRFESDSAETALPDASQSASRVVAEKPDSKASDAVAQDPGPTAGESAAVAGERLRGTVTLADTNGATIPAPNGSLMLVAWGERDAVRVNAEVEAGRWSVPATELAGRVEVRVEQLYLEGDYVAVDSPSDRVEWSTSTVMEIIAHRRQPTILHVVDKTNGSNMSGIRLVEGGGDWGQAVSHPGERYNDRLLATELVSPIALEGILSAEKRMRNQSFFVGAEGFCWALEELPFELGGNVTVELEPGGALEVQLAGYDPASEATLRLWRSDLGAEEPDRQRRPDAEVEIGKRDFFRFPALRPGSYHASIDIGKWYDKPRVLGAADALVEPGKLAQLTVDSESAPAVVRAAMSGVVLVPKAWRPATVQVVARLLDTPLAGFDDRHSIPTRKSSGSPGRNDYFTFAFRFKDMQVGTYELGVFRPGFSVSLELPPEGREDIELKVPEPVDFELRLVNRITGEDVKTTKAYWNPKRPEGVNSGGLESLTADPETGIYSFRAPAMEIDFMIHEFDYTSIFETLDLSSGITRHTFQLSPATLIEVRLFDGETLISLSSDNRIKGEAAPGTEGKLGLRTQDSERWLTQVSDPGGYLITIPEITGFYPVPIQEIQALAGETVRHRVELVRKP